MKKRIKDRIRFVHIFFTIVGIALALILGLLIWYGTEEPTVSITIVIAGSILIGGIIGLLYGCHIAKKLERFGERVNSAMAEAIDALEKEDAKRKQEDE